MPFDALAEYGALAIITGLFIMMILNLIKSQKEQTEDLDDISKAIAKIEVKNANVESIVIKLIDRINRQEDVSTRHREDIIRELNEVTDDLAYLKGRINGNSKN